MQNYLRMDTQLQCKNLSKSWIERKSDNSKSRSEYVQNSAIGMYRYYCL